jgi:hypothetical protein
MRGYEFDIHQDIGAVIAGVTDVLYGLCLAMEASGHIDHERLVGLMDAAIADQRLRGDPPARSITAEALKEALEYPEPPRAEERRRSFRIIEDGREVDPPEERD